MLDAAILPFRVRGQDDELGVGEFHGDARFGCDS